MRKRELLWHMSRPEIVNRICVDSLVVLYDERLTIGGDAFYFLCNKAPPLISEFSIETVGWYKIIRNFSGGVRSLVSQQQQQESQPQ